VRAPLLLHAPGKSEFPRSLHLHLLRTFALSVPAICLNARFHVAELSRHEVPGAPSRPSCSSRLVLLRLSCFTVPRKQVILALLTFLRVWLMRRPPTADCLHHSRTLVPGIRHHSDVMPTVLHWIGTPRSLALAEIQCCCVLRCIGLPLEFDAANRPVVWLLLLRSARGGRHGRHL
jgi:hypothetical protein